jgi:hypothetical protein
MMGDVQAPPAGGGLGAGAEKGVEPMTAAQRSQHQTSASLTLQQSGTGATHRCELSAREQRLLERYAAAPRWSLHPED